MRKWKLKVYLEALLNEIANSIHPMIELTSDIPSNHTDGKLPVLDLKVKLGLQNQIDFEFYEKKTKNSRVILASSALPWRQKETILVNEAVRRLRNTTPRLGSETQNFHLNVFMVKLKNSGYSANFRAKIIRKAKAIYSNQLENDRKGTKPLYRSRKQILEDRSKRKHSKISWWKTGKQNFNTVLFVPPTPGGILAKKMRERQAQLSKNSKLKIKVVEQGGVKIKSLLSKADPFPTQDCISERCPVCRTTAFTELGKKSQFRTPCSAMGVGYSVTCVNCEKLGRKSSYEGETGRPARVRFAEHISELERKVENNPLQKHTNLEHPTTQGLFRFKILKKFRDPLTRQANEGVRIQDVGQSQNILNSKSEFNHPPTNRVSVIKNRRLQQSVK